MNLILVRNNNINTLIRCTLNPLKPDQVRYHCHIMILLKFTPRCETTFRRKVWYYKLTDSDKYREELSEGSLLQKSQTYNNIEHINRTFQKLCSTQQKNTFLANFKLSKLSQCMRFPTMWYVRPAKPQICLRIRAV